MKKVIILLSIVFVLSACVQTRVPETDLSNFDNTGQNYKISGATTSIKEKKRKANIHRNFPKGIYYKDGKIVCNGGCENIVAEPDKLTFFDDRYAQDGKYIYLYEETCEECLGLNCSCFYNLMKVNGDEILEEVLKNEYCPKNGKINTNMTTKDGGEVNMPPGYVNFNGNYKYVSSDKSFVLDNFCKVKYVSKQQF